MIRLESRPGRSRGVSSVVSAGEQGWCVAGKDSQCDPRPARPDTQSWRKWTAGHWRWTNWGQCEEYCRCGFKLKKKHERRWISLNFVLFVFTPRSQWWAPPPEEGSRLSLRTVSEVCLLQKTSEHIHWHWGKIKSSVFLNIISYVCLFVFVISRGTFSSNTIIVLRKHTLLVQTLTGRSVAAADSLWTVWKV